MSLWSILLISWWKELSNCRQGNWQTTNHCRDGLLRNLGFYMIGYYHTCSIYRETRSCNNVFFRHAARFLVSHHVEMKRTNKTKMMRQEKLYKYPEINFEAARLHRCFKIQRSNKNEKTSQRLTSILKEWWASTALWMFPSVTLEMQVILQIFCQNMGVDGKSMIL